MTPERLRDYLRFYQDLGFQSIYRRGELPVAAAAAAAPAPEIAAPAPRQAAPPPPSAPPLSTLKPMPPPKPKPVAEAPAIVTAPASILPLAPEGDTMDRIREDVGDCKRCRLCQGRNKIVFGSGNENSKLVFVGEGPGADEDASGLPFVGRAGQLLTQMIEGTSSKEGIPLKRADVYICNVVKCRPPDNRTPEADEMEICGQFLFRQLLAIQPKAICALG